MADIKRKVPNLRFKGFTDDWEQRKLRDISTRVLRKNKDLQSTLPLTISAQDGLVDQTTFFHKQVASKQLSNYILLFKGEFAYNKSYSEGYPFGAIKRLNKYSKGVLSTLYIVFKPKNVNSDFLEHYYDTSKWYREIYRNAAEGARNHGLLNISAKDFFGTMLYMPQKNEQALIANVLDHLDSLIALQQRKLALLKQLKKGLLQKMFADKDSKRPVLRFKGFHDDWEQRKVSDIFTVTRGQVLATTKISEVKTNEMYFPVYSSQTKNNGLMGYYNKYLFNTAITWTTDGANAGTVNYREGKFYSTNVNGVLLSDDGYANKAIAEILDRVAWRHVSRVGNPKLMNNVMSNIKISIPSSFEEQNAISEFLIKFDHLIALHQRKQNHLKLLKKSLLQQMFM